MTNLLTGRISGNLSEIMNKVILEPQFRYEVEHYLPYYLEIEIAMLTEYLRMELINPLEFSELHQLLKNIKSDVLTADLEFNMSDIAFAIERLVEQQLVKPVICWHMDRSRNDFQACAQIMFGRNRWLSLIESLVQLIHSISILAVRYVDIPMPGYTHYQTAQIITPGFYLSAITEEMLRSLKRWIDTFDEINQCPLGSGAMAGVELSWDRERLSQLLGFQNPFPNALGAVASREWALRISSELSVFSVLISRFVTDLIYWGSCELSFLQLPDHLSGISSAMPQKKNYPILERIRGKSAHLSGFHMDLILGQRNTSFTNLVETSKEASTHLISLFETAEATTTLLRLVLDNMSFDNQKMLDICQRDYFGGFTLANRLTEKFGIPYRKSQIIVGKYITNMSLRTRKPSEIEPELLQELCKNEGFEVTELTEILSSAFNVYENIYVKKSSGSTNPENVSESIIEQQQVTEALQKQVAIRRNALENISNY